MKGLNKVKNGLKYVQVLVLILNALLFVFTSIFTVVALYSTWGKSNLSYVLFWLFFIDVVLYLLRYIFRGMRKRPENITNLLLGINIIRKVLKIVYVVVALLLAFTTYDNNVVSIVARSIMTWFSVCMAITYILVQIFVFIVRKSLGKVKEGFYARTFKIKNKRSR